MKEYPKAEIKEIESEGQHCYEAEFTQEGKEYEALYSPEGKKMALITELKVDQLPEAIRKAIGAKAKVEELERFDLSSGNHIYEVNIKYNVPVFYTEKGVGVSNPCGSN